jgi:hypothetical protein
VVDLRKHSSRHLETKIILPIPETKAYEREIHYYLFSPPQLCVNKTTNPEPEILQKFQAHGRYSSPEFTFEELLDEENEISPLTVLHAYVLRLEQDLDSVPERNVIHELQSMVNSIRHENKACLRDCKDFVQLSMVDKTKELLDDWYRNTRLLQSKVRALISRMEKICPEEERMLVAFSWADEAISLLDEKQAIDFYMVASPPGDARLSLVLPELLRFSREESRYRSDRGYLSGSTDPETVQYRKAVLKKWTQSALYLVPDISRWPSRVSQILAGTAAAIAMTFAILTSIFAENAFIKNSLQWSLIIIIAYVFKDRIKEWLRTFFNAILPKMMADEISSFISPKDGSRICSSRIKLNYLEKSEVPKKVREIRRDKTNPFADMLPDEDVIHYVRNLRMHPAGKRKTRPDKRPLENNFTLITRIRLDDFLKEMDDPNDIMLRMDPDADELDQLNSERVYHLHLVIRECSDKDKVDSYSHHCVVVNKSGIVRIERLP